MDAGLIRAELEQIPAMLRGADVRWPVETTPRRMLLTGMGS